MTIAIMQPTYLPWLGYFDLIDQSDLFVFLDTVQFEKQSWQQRNRIKVQQELHWLTVPVLRAGNSTDRICEMQVNQSPIFPKKHLCTIGQNYSKAPHFKTYFPALQALLESRERSLSEFNQAIIRWLAQVLGVTTRFVKSSDLHATGKRSDLLVAICREVQSSRYLTPMGSVGYLNQDRGLFEEQGISIAVQRYEHPIYRQMTSPFLPFASTLDLLFNEGERSLEIIRSGRALGLSLQEAVKLSAGAP